MGTLAEYVEWRGDLTFEQSPLCEVDNLIFSMMSYMDFKKIVPSAPTARPVPLLAAVKKYLQRKKDEPSDLGLLFSPEIITVATKAARSSRFGGINMVGYVNKVSEDPQKQFSAVSFLIGEDTCFVAFRGTDDTLIGWRESLSMSFVIPVPSQKEAVKYLEAVSEAFPERRLYLGGHSKGGNLAVWAAVKCSETVNSRINAVYSNDGPGFSKEFICSQAYANTRDRIHTVVPQSSVVGMLLEHEENYEVIQSTQTGVFQHDATSWVVLGGKFIHLESVSEESRRVDRTFKKWMSEIGPEQRKKVIDSMYEILSANAKTLTDLSNDKTKVVKAWNSFDVETRRAIRRFIGIVMSNGRKTK